MGLLKGSSGCGRKKNLSHRGEEWVILLSLSYVTAPYNCDTHTHKFWWARAMPMFLGHAIQTCILFRNILPKHLLWRAQSICNSFRRKPKGIKHYARMAGLS